MKKNINNKKAEDSNLITVFSRRKGNIICVDGTVIEFEKPMLVDKDVFIWLDKSFPGQIIQID